MLLGATAKPFMGNTIPDKERRASWKCQAGKG